MRLDELAAAEGDGVEIEWRSFLLRPAPEERDMLAFTKYTMSWERPGSLEPRATFHQWSGEHLPPASSVPSAVGGKVAATFGSEEFDAFHHGLLTAYFTDNRTISEVDVMVDVAEGAGIAADEFLGRWHHHGEALVQAVATDHQQASMAGITGVPAVVVDGKYLVTGAVDLDHYQGVLTRVRAERAESVES
ncbi:MAG: hypothetical protein GY929_16190 [Actinomycetia bacterium]|nr:hypothetical protein [Actinomycetes bacterium]